MHLRTRKCSSDPFVIIGNRKSSRVKRSRFISLPPPPFPRSLRVHGIRQTRIYQALRERISRNATSSRIAVFHVFSRARELPFNRNFAPHFWRAHHRERRPYAAADSPTRCIIYSQHEKYTRIIDLYPAMRIKSARMVHDTYVFAVYLVSRIRRKLADEASKMDRAETILRGNPGSVTRTYPS